MRQQNATVPQKGINLFHSLIKEDVFPFHTPGERKGRAAELIEARNRCIIYRYYYYAKIMHLKYDQIIKALSAEFFLAPRTLTNLFQEYHVEIKATFNEKKSAKELKEMYQSFNWNN